MSARRVDLNGRPLANKVMDTRCAECGMGTVSAAEFHPFRACELYRESHNSETVWAAMEAEGIVPLGYLAAAIPSLGEHNNERPAPSPDPEGEQP